MNHVLFHVAPSRTWDLGKNSNAAPRVARLSLPQTPSEPQSGVKSCRFGWTRVGCRYILASATLCMANIATGEIGPLLGWLAGYT